MALTDSDKRLKRTPDNDRDKMKAKAERVLKAEIHPLDGTAQSMFGINYDQLGPLQLIAVNAAAGKEG
jgi:hypothetical protein